MLKNKKIRTILLVALLVCAMGSTIFAKQVTETVSIIYDNIKIIIDGIEYNAKDANGNEIEPFVYNGTTYLPVRAIADAFDKDVTWEPQTSTVVLGTKNFDWLDQMPYANYETTGGQNVLSAISKGTSDTNNIKYDRGIRFFLSQSYGYSGYVELNDGSYESWQKVEYLLNGNYKTFNGKYVFIKGYDAINSLIKVYGDGKLLETSQILTNGANAKEFNIDVSNCKVLKIEASVPNLYKRNGDQYSSVGIADARLERK